MQRQSQQHVLRLHTMLHGNKTRICTVLQDLTSYCCTDSTHTHTHLFNGPLSRTTRVRRYQKGKTDLDFTEARVSEWQWHQHQLGPVQVYTSLQTGFTFLVPAHPGSPGKRAVKWVSVCKELCT